MPELLEKTNKEKEIPMNLENKSTEELKKILDTMNAMNKDIDTLSKKWGWSIYR